MGGNLPGWGWGMANGSLSTILGMLLLAQWPTSGHQVALTATFFHR
jgi:hypothetical protein